MSLLSAIDASFGLRDQLKDLSSRILVRQDHKPSFLNGSLHVSSYAVHDDPDYMVIGSRNYSLVVPNDGRVAVYSLDPGYHNYASVTFGKTEKVTPATYAIIGVSVERGDTEITLESLDKVDRVKLNASYPTSIDFVTQAMNDLARGYSVRITPIEANILGP